MADGGFLVKFDGKEVKRCYRFSATYDTWTYTTNSDAPQPLPEGLKSITLVIENQGR